jgi:medium-chain acyl-[acyl-carrier-protein] hydrolase
MRTPRANPSATQRFFVFHHAGGMGNAYFQWHTLLPPDTELVIVDLPGRGMLAHEKRLENFDELLQKLILEISPALDLPFIFFGHSLGALLAFELSRKIPPALLSNLRGVALSSFKPPTLKNLQERERISDLPLAEFLEQMNRIAPLPSEITQHPEALNYFLSLLRSDFKLIESYSLQDESFLEVNAVILGGDADPLISPAQLAGWSQFLRMPEEVKIFPGDHFYIFKNAQSVLREILKVLKSNP